MNARRYNGTAHFRRGTVLIYFTVAMVLFFAVVSVAVDFGHVRVVKTQLQSAADGAARAACQALPNGVTAAQNAAVAAAALNAADGTAVSIDPNNDIDFGIWNPTTKTFSVLHGANQSGANAVRVTAARTAAKGNAINLSFASAIGKSNFDIQTTGTVCLTGNAGTYSLIGLNSVTLSGNAFTDSYNATQGTYAVGSAHHKGSIASNGDITLSNFAKVDGDARCGVGKSTKTQNAAVVTGLNAPMARVMSYPSVTLPASYTDLGDVNMSSGTTSVAGGTYLIHNLVLSGTSTINWNGPVKLYIANSYAVSQSAAINTYQNLPANRILYFLPTCTTATWSGTNVCVGELYAPDTDFTVSGSVELFGRITARSITNSSSGGMHYDESLSPPGATAVRETVSTEQ